MKKRFGKCLFFGIPALLCAVFSACLCSEFVLSHAEPTGEHGWEHAQASLLSSGDSSIQSGNYYLAADTELSGSLVIGSGATVELCLNGFRLTSAVTTSPILTIESGGTLLLYDCGADGCTLPDHTHGGELTSTTQASAIRIAGGAVSMYGGAIRNNTAEYGGGVSVADGGSFALYGGEISGNRATYSYNCAGGGVYVENGSFTMTGGSITGNFAGGTFGGGVCIDRDGTARRNCPAERLRTTRATACTVTAAPCLCAEASKCPLGFPNSRAGTPFLWTRAASSFCPAEPSSGARTESI